MEVYGVKPQYLEMGKKMHEAIFFLLQNLALQLGLGSNASQRDSNYVATAFSLTKATYCYA